MSLRREYAEDDLRAVRCALLSTTGEVQLGKGASATDPQWIRTRSGDDKTILQDERQLRQELFPYIGNLVAAPQEDQPLSDRWRKFIVSESH